MNNDLKKAHIKAIYLHPVQKVPLVFIVDEEESVVLPMSIGFLEAQAILTAWQGLAMPRPMTADLLTSIITEDFGANVERMVIHDVKDGAFLAKIIMQKGERTIERDSRPSDALALIVRTKSPVFLTQTVINHLQTDQENAQAMLSFLEAESQDSDDIIKF